MRRWITAVVGTAVMAVGTAGAATSADAAQAARADWRCRSGVLHPVADLTATTTVCGRFAQGEWQGKGTVRLTAVRKPVSGLLVDGAKTGAGGSARHQQAYTVRPGHDVVLRIGGRQKAAATDAASRWEVVLISDPGEARSVVQYLYSPDLRRGDTGTRPSTFKGRLPRTCLVKDVLGTSRAVRASTCLTQRGSFVVIDPITVRAYGASGAYLEATLLVDGKVVARGGPAFSNAPGMPTKLVLPAMSVQVLHGEHRAVLKLAVDDTASVLSRAIRLRG